MLHLDKYMFPFFYRNALHSGHSNTGLAVNLFSMFLLYLTVSCSWTKRVFEQVNNWISHVILNQVTTHPKTNINPGKPTENTQRNCPKPERAQCWLECLTNGCFKREPRKMGDFHGPGLKSGMCASESSFFVVVFLKKRDPLIGLACRYKFTRGLPLKSLVDDRLRKG